MAQAHAFRKAKSLFSTTLSAGIGTGTGETITPASVTGLPTDTEVTLTIDRVDSAGTATPTKTERITGVVSGGNLTSYTRAVDGTTEQAHTAGAVVEYIWNADDLNDLVDGILVEHDQDGGHGDITADSINTHSLPSGTSTFVTLAATQTLTNKTLTAPTITSPVLTLNNIVPATTGRFGFDDTNKNLVIGDGTTAQTFGSSAWKVWSPTFTGFSSDPTGGLYYYQLLGKVCIVHVRQPNGGTSNATGFTITSPLTALTRSNEVWYGKGVGTDNGAFVGTVLAQISSGGTSFTLTTADGAGLWTGSSTKSASFTIIYEAA